MEPDPSDLTGLRFLGNDQREKLVPHVVREARRLPDVARIFDVGAGSVSGLLQRGPPMLPNTRAQRPRVIV